MWCTVNDKRRTLSKVESFGFEALPVGATLNPTRNPQPATLLRVGLRVQRILDTLRRQYNNHLNHNYCYQANERHVLEHYKLVFQSYYTWA